MKGALFAITVVTAASTCLAAEPYTFTIPGKGWALKMVLPPLAAYQAEDAEAGFRFVGSCGKDVGVTVSIFVESSEVTDSGECRTELWAQGSKNAMIREETVRLVELGGKPAVTYTIEGEFQGQHVKAQNANVYIAHAGTCVDVHVSRFPFTEAAEAELALIASSVAVESQK